MIKSKELSYINLPPEIEDRESGKRRIGPITTSESGLILLFLQLLLLFLLPPENSQIRKTIQRSRSPQSLRLTTGITILLKDNQPIYIERLIILYLLWILKLFSLFSLKPVVSYQSSVLEKLVFSKEVSTAKSILCLKFPQKQNDHLSESLQESGYLLAY